jgi:hypothetical protein
VREDSLIKRVLLVAAVLSIALAFFLRTRRVAPAEKWTSFNGKMAALEYPLGWKIDEGENHRAREIHMVLTTSHDEVLTFSLIDYLPTSGIRDAGLFVKDDVRQSPQQQSIVVKQTSFGRFPAQKFSTYIPETTDNVDSTGSRVFQASYTEMKEIIFVRENGDVCEITYALPKSGSEDYEPIFQKIVDSIRLK